MIKFVYFDVGGVAIKDFSKRPDLWADFKKDMKISEEYWDMYCSGKLDIGEIPPNLSVSFEKFIDRFVSHFQVNQSIWKCVDFAKKNFRIGLLTNMYLGMFEQIQRYNLLPPTEWEIIVDTSVVRLRKPEKPIYALAQQKAGVRPQEILFVDNVLENLEVPKEMGWDTFHYDSSDYEQSSENLLEYLKDEITK